MSNKKIKPFPGNPRKITPERLRTLGESLNEYGSLDGFVINVGPGKYENCIISGNQKNKHINLSKAKIDISERYETPTETGTVAIGHVTHNGELFPYREVVWDDRKCEIGNIRANNLGGRNDVDLLNQFEADILEAGGIDMDFEMFIDTFMVGDGEGGIPNNALNSEAQEDGFEPPAEIEEIQTDIVLGDLFEIGPHRLLCGDSTKAEDVERLMGGEKADICVTDPPYGVKMDKGFEGFEGFGGFGTPIKRRQYTDDWDSEIPDKKAFDLIFEHSKVAVIFGGNFFAHMLPQSKHWIFWDKKQTMPTFGDGELCWTNVDRKSIVKIEVVYNGLIGKEKDRFHPTQKPVKIVSEILDRYSDLNALCIDFFCGSGTTMVAADQLNRRCFGMEISPKYCQVIIDRVLKLRPDIEIKKNGEPYEPNTQN